MSNKVKTENSEDHDLVGKSAVKGLLSRIDKPKTNDQWEGDDTWGGEHENVNYP